MALRFTILIFITALHSYLPVAAQIGNWSAYLGNANLSPRWTMHNEVQLRNYDFQTMDQLLLRNGIGYNFSENNNNLELGYAYIQSRPDPLNATIRKHEHRIFQQFITKQRYSRVLFMHRYRFEQRFQNQTVNYRFRYFLATFIALNSLEIAKGTWYVAATNEIFIRTNDNYFDRHRIALGLGYAFTDHLKIQLDFLQQILPSNSRSSHQLQLTIFNNLAFKHHR
jgi:hypothetical protein